MIEWYLFYLVFVIGGTWLFCKVFMPENMRGVKLNVDAINEIFDDTVRENKAAWASIKAQLKDR